MKERIERAVCLLLSAGLALGPTCAALAEEEEIIRRERLYEVD